MAFLFGGPSLARLADRACGGCRRAEDNPVPRTTAPRLGSVMPSFFFPICLVMLMAVIATPTQAQIATATVMVGSHPYAVAMNSTTNKIYAVNQLGSSVTVIDGATNATTTVPVATSPQAVAVNPITNKIYVASSGGTVTIIDGATNSASTVNAGSGPNAIAVNSVTNKIYITNADGTMTVLDGATNTTSPVAVGSNPQAVSVNPVTNKIYVANSSSATVTVVAGAT